MKKNKWLIAIDLDRTLIRDGSKYPNNNLNIDDIKVLKKLKQSGHQILIVTGRSWSATKEIANMINLDIIYAVFNGSLILDYKNKNEIFINNLDSKWVNSVIDNKLIKPITNNYVIETKNIIHTKNPSDKELQEMYKNEEIKHHDTSKKISASSFYLKLKKNNLDKNTLVKNLKNEYKDNLVFWYWRTDNENVTTLEVNDGTFNKWSAVHKVSLIEKVDLENIIVFGDNLNDIDMIKNARYGIAMLNGLDEVKEVANDVTNQDNNNQGVTKYLINFFDIELNI